MRGTPPVIPSPRLCEACLKPVGPAGFGLVQAGTVLQLHGAQRPQPLAPHQLQKSVVQAIPSSCLPTALRATTTYSFIGPHALTTLSQPLFLRLNSVPPSSSTPSGCRYLLFPTVHSLRALFRRRVTSLAHEHPSSHHISGVHSFPFGLSADTYYNTTYDTTLPASAICLILLPLRAVTFLESPSFASRHIFFDH